MSEPFVYPETPMDRGKVLTAEEVEQAGRFARYETPMVMALATGRCPAVKARLGPISHAAPDITQRPLQRTP